MEEVSKEIKGQWIVISCYQALFINEICTCIALEFEEKVKKSWVYKKEFKKMFNIFMKEIRKREYETYDVTKDFNAFLADCNDAMEDAIKLDLMRFENAMYMELTKHNVPEASLMAKWELLGTMLEYSIVIIEQRINELLKMVGGIDYLLGRYKLKGAHERYLKANLELQKVIKGDFLVDFTKSKMCNDGLHVLDNKLQDAKFIARIINSADKEE